MNKWAKTSLVALRLTMGWVYLYAGYAKIIDPTWTAAGYLSNAKTFPGFYQWFASSANIEWVNLLNMGGLFLIGAALILGAGVRLASYMGVLITVLYYFPVLTFPEVGAHGYIIDDHIIYALVFVLFAAFAAGRTWGLDGWLERKGLFNRLPWLAKIWG